jgi:hypothetical protein
MQTQVYANTVRKGGRNHTQLIDFFPGPLEAQAEIEKMELVNVYRNPYIYGLACELPAVGQAREDNLKAWELVDEDEIFMTGDQELALGLR